MKKLGQVLTGKLLYEKLKSLKEVGRDKDWNIFYIDSDETKWCESLPNGGYHGGGAPELTQIDYFPWEKGDTDK